jgi:signal transduction histidine kinase
MTADVATVRGWLDRHPRPADAAVALVVLAVSLQPLVQQLDCGCGAPPAWGYALVAVQCLPLVWRRRWPFLIGILVGLLTAVHALTSLPDPAVPFAGLVAVYTVAAHASRRLSLLTAGLTAVVLTSVLLIDLDRADAEDFLVNYLVFATAWLLGDGARARRDRAAELEARIAQSERLRAVEADRVLAEERTRIAREMHDVVAHAVSLMVVQAEAGPVVVHRDPDRAVGVFDSISTTGKSALVEMRRLLGVLRTESPELAPQPGLAALPELVARCRDADLAVELRLEGEERPLPPGADLAAYRVVQEALTNVLKHAGPASAEVTVRFDADAVLLQVRDDGAGGVDAGTGGNGLVGMRERAAVLGGTLTAGPAEGGGWLVEARLPAGVPVAP